MQYRVLGRTGLKVSELCLGTMTFGEDFFQIAVVDQAGANAMVARALEAGINFFDTADVYSYGESEKVLGQAVIELGTVIFGVSAVNSLLIQSVAESQRTQEIARRTS